jgi:myosin heavy subunit
MITFSYFRQAATKEGNKGGTLEEQIVQTNPVLEAFGTFKQQF